MSKTVHQARTIVPLMVEQHLSIDSYGTEDKPAFALRVFEVDEKGRQTSGTIYLDREQWAELSDAAVVAAAATPQDKQGSSEHWTNERVNVWQERNREKHRAAASQGWLLAAKSLGTIVISPGQELEQEALDNLIRGGLLIPTEQHGRTVPNLYTITDYGREMAKRIK